MLLDDLATLIEDDSIAEQGTDLFKAGLPSTPDASLAMIEYPGRPGVYVFGGIAYELPRVRLVSRGAPNDYETPRAQIEAVYQMLLDASGSVTGGARYLNWTPLQPPYVLGQDKNERWMLGFNVEVWKEISSI